MEIIVWLAVGIAVFAGDVQTAVSDPYKTESDCIAAMVSLQSRIDTNDQVFAFAQQCVQMTVKEKAAKPATSPKISKPKPNALGDTGERTLNVSPQVL